MRTVMAALLQGQPLPEAVQFADEAAPGQVAGIPVPPPLQPQQQQQAGEQPAATDGLPAAATDAGGDAVMAFADATP